MKLLVPSAQSVRFKLLAIAAALIILPSAANAGDAVSVLGKDFVFPNQIEGLPRKLSEISGLQINRFKTKDNVELAYWEAGQGEPLILLPGWSSNGARLINLIALLSKDFHVYVLDPRSGGLSQKVNYGNNIARHAMDLRELRDHLKIGPAYFAGHSMGASVLWGYIDLFGTEGIKKIAFVDEPPSIYSRTDWSEKERQEAGGFVVSPELMLDGLAKGVNRVEVNKLVADWPKELPGTRESENAAAFAEAVIDPDMDYLKLVLFDHITNDWREVIRNKIDIPAAIFAPEDSNRFPSQKWIASVIPSSKLFVYTDEDHGDHSLLTKNPVKFSRDLSQFFRE
jgi:pimeloyl-ACP methyl ester carboxylesterase